MKATKRATVSFQSDLYLAMRRRAAIDNCSISESVNQAVRAFLAEDLANQVDCAEQLVAVHGAPGVHAGLDPVLADLQFMTLAKHAN